jgi:hypothetical protein
MSETAPAEQDVAAELPTKAIEYAQKLLDASISIVGASHIQIGPEWARDPKVVALAILCRTISNFRASVLLVQQGHVMEARALVRLQYENMLWLGALRERGSEFVKDMIEDEAFNRKALAELTLKMSGKYGADASGPDALQFRGIIRDIAQQFPKTKKLRADATAAEGAVETAYVEYGRLSLDAVHCSVTALGRHLSRETIDKKIELVVSVVPLASADEAFSTVLHACRALMGAAVGANEIVGFTNASGQLVEMVEEFERNGWQTIH